MQIDNIYSDFIQESQENLDRFKEQITFLEMNTTDNTLLTRPIRTIHAIKETFGFLGFTNLESISCRVEVILIDVRASKQPITPRLISLALKATVILQNELSYFEMIGERRYASEYPDSFQTAA